MSLTGIVEELDERVKILRLVKDLRSCIATVQDVVA